MKTYEIKSLENGKVLETVVADGFNIGEGGIVTFYRNEEKETTLALGNKTLLNTTTIIAVTQVSSSTLIIEKPAGKPEVIDILKRTPIEQDPAFKYKTPAPVPTVMVRKGF